MADDVKIQSPVEIQSDSKERVAYDLMVKVSYADATPSEKRDKKYWFGLYMQSLRAVQGCNLEYILKED